jgi:hypothetical protein
MAKKIVIPEKFRIWIEVRKRYHLSDAQIQMARELGLNPHKFGKIANEKQEPWMIPLVLATILIRGFYYGIKLNPFRLWTFSIQRRVSEWLILVE